MSDFRCKTGIIGGIGEPARTPEVHYARDNVASRISEYSDLVSRLEEKLSCVMRASVPSQNVDGAKLDLRSSLAADLQNFANIANENNNKLQDILDRLEI